MAGYSPEDFDYAVRTVWGEARGEPTLGQQSVAAVIRNRARAAKTGFKNVVLAPNQFEPWSTKRDQLMGLSPQSPEYQRIADSIRPIFDSEADPTNGATHFYSPKVQAALGRKPPSWDNGTGFEIGTHRFFKLGGPVPAAPNSTTQPSPASAPITTGSIPGSPPMADFNASGLSPEEVALRRRYGQQAYAAGSDASPVGHWTQALARVVQGANAGVWNSQAQEGETAGRKAMVDAIMSGNPKSVLGTQYGAAMAPQFLEQSIKQSDPMYQEQLKGARFSNMEKERELTNPSSQFVHFKEGETAGMFNKKTGKMEWITPPNQDTQQREFDKNFAKEQAPKLYSESANLYTQADEARNIYKGLLDLAPYAKTGFTGPIPADVMLNLRKMGASLGLTGSDSIAPTEIYKYLAQKGVFDLTSKLKPASNLDMIASENATTSMKTDPSTLPLALPILMRTQERAMFVERAKMNAFRSGRPPDMEGIMQAVNEKLPLLDISSISAPAQAQKQPQKAFSAPPQGAIGLLRQQYTNPEVVRQFEEKYGPGSAKRYLGQP